MTRSEKILIISALVGAVLLGITSWVVQEKITSVAQREVGESLSTVLDTTHQAVRSWFKEHKAIAKISADSPQVRGVAEELLARSRNRAALLASPAQERLRAWFGPLQAATRYQGYFVIGPDNLNLASSRDQNVGFKNLLVGQEKFFQEVWAGATAVSLPEVSDVPLPDTDGQLREGLPTMFVGAPVLDDAGKVIAIFTLRINPRQDFTSLLQQGRIGQTGETYAFDGQGRLISESRFDHHLRKIGLLSSDQQGILNIEIRDPGVELLQGIQSKTARDQQPFTRMATTAIAGRSGTDLDGYSDYRGVSVVGAWVWDSDLGFGITTELDAKEAYQTLRATQQTIITLTILAGLLLVGLTMIYIVYRQRRRAEIALRNTHDELEMRVAERTAELAAANEELQTENIERERAQQYTRELLQQNRDLTQRLFSTQEEERRHLARELHDELGQWLTAIHLNAQAISQRSEEKFPEIHASARNLIESATRMHQDVRGMIRQLRPALLDELGLVDSLGELIDQWQALHPEIDCAVSLDNDLDDLGYSLNITLYRIIQEALTNVAKHAEANRVLIQLCRRTCGAAPSGTLELMIEDNGKGIDPAAPGNGFGLAGMRERTLAAGGEFKVSSPKGTGVRVQVCLPISKKGDGNHAPPRLMGGGQGAGVSDQPPGLE